MTDRQKSSENSQQDFLDRVLDRTPGDDEDRGVFVAVLVTVMTISAPFAALVAYFEGLDSALVFLLLILLVCLLHIPLRHVAEGIGKFAFWVQRRVDGDDF